MTKTLVASPEFEQRPTREVEQKFMPLFPEKLAHLRELGRPVEQYYLSHPSEPFSLRLREAFADNGELVYTATLKDRGVMTPAGTDRLEVEVPVTAELYQYYKPGMPLIRKLRTEVNKNVLIDYYDDDHVQVESEDPIAWTSFCDRYGANFIEMTGQLDYDNEWRAHLDYRRQHGGHEALKPVDDLEPERIVADIFERYRASEPVFVKICGRSGSGKSTIVRQVQATLAERGVLSDVISTDDYHRGASWLRQHNNGQDWTEWDHPIVYDTASMAQDLSNLRAGRPIQRRKIDFSVVEAVYGEAITPVPVVIIEGIYAGHGDFDSFDALSYDMPTPLATCIGRRLLRDMRERPDFADPKVSLRYMLEQAEPMYRAQAKPAEAA